jgi:hypothetical protein
MIKKAATCLIPALFLLASAFTPAGKPVSWKAVLQIEGKGKTYSLTSEAIYGGHNAGNRNIFLFGKNHMFINKAEAEAMKVFQDLCTTNAMQQFQFEINGVNSLDASSKGKMMSGNINFKKRQAIQADLRSSTVNGKKQNSIQTKGDLKVNGFQFTPEAENLFTGKYTLTFISNN